MDSQNNDRGTFPSLRVATSEDSSFWLKLRTTLLVFAAFVLMGAVAGTATRWVGDALTFDGSSGNNAFTFDVNGLRADFGTGANDYASSDGTTVTFASPVASAATVGTAASGTGITADYSGNLRSFVHKVTVTSSAMTAAATTDVTLAVTPANARIIRVKADVTTKFIGGALTAVTVQCGNSAGGNQYLLAGDIFTAATVLGDVAAEVGAGLLTATWADFGTAASGTNGAITVQCRFTCTTANCNAATQGTAVFYVEGVAY